MSENQTMVPLQAKLAVKPWFNTLVNGVGLCVVECIDQGMPVTLGEEIIREVANRGLELAIKSDSR